MAGLAQAALENCCVHRWALDRSTQALGKAQEKRGIFTDF
jgi:hypothetical protein